MGQEGLRLNIGFSNVVTTNDFDKFWWSSGGGAKS